MQGLKGMHKSAALEEEADAATPKVIHKACACCWYACWRHILGRGGHDKSRKTSSLNPPVEVTGKTLLLKT